MVLQRFPCLCLSETPVLAISLPRGPLPSHWSSTLRSSTTTSTPTPGGATVWAGSWPCPPWCASLCLRRWRSTTPQGRWKRWAATQYFWTAAFQDGWSSCLAACIEAPAWWIERWSYTCTTLYHVFSFHLRNEKQILCALGNYLSSSLAFIHPSFFLCIPVFFFVITVNIQESFSMVVNITMNILFEKKLINDQLEPKPVVILVKFSWNVKPSSMLPNANLPFWTGHVNSGSPSSAPPPSTCPSPSWSRRNCSPSSRPTETACVRRLRPRRTATSPWMRRSPTARAHRHRGFSRMTGVHWWRWKNGEHRGTAAAGLIRSHPVLSDPTT